MKERPPTMSRPRDMKSVLDVNDVNELAAHTGGDARRSPRPLTSHVVRLTSTQWIDRRTTRPKQDPDGGAIAYIIPRVSRQPRRQDDRGRAASVAGVCTRTSARPGLHTSAPGHGVPPSRTVLVAVAVAIGEACVVDPVPTELGVALVGQELEVIDPGARRRRRQLALRLRVVCRPITNGAAIPNGRCW